MATFLAGNNKRKYYLKFAFNLIKRQESEDKIISLFSCVLGGRKEQKENREKTKEVERICVLTLYQSVLTFVC